jgi:hypothetical protein
MVVSDADDDWVDDTIDAIEETTTPGLPYPPRSDYTLYVPDFVPGHVHDHMTEKKMLAAHDLFLKKDWLALGLTVEIQRHFPQHEDSCAETGQRSMEPFKDHCFKLFPVNRVFVSI